MDDVTTDNKINHRNKFSEQITKERIEESANETSMNVKTRQDNKSERKGNGEVLRKYCQMNAQGLITKKQPQEKVSLLRETMQEERPLFLALTETWLHDHREAEVQIEDYNIFRKDRPLRRCSGKGRHVGGVALYTKSSWLPDSNEILGYSNTVVDVLAIHSRSENIIIAVLYRQPENNSCTESKYKSTYKDFIEPLKKLEEIITKYKNLETEILILGDFNMPSADWDMGTHKEGASVDQTKLVSKTTGVM